MHFEDPWYQLDPQQPSEPSSVCAACSSVRSSKVLGTSSNTSGPIRAIPCQHSLLSCDEREGHQYQLKTLTPIRAVLPPPRLLSCAEAEGPR